MQPNAFQIKPKAPACVAITPGCVSIAFVRPCGLQVHHEILSLEPLGGLTIGVRALDESSDPNVSTEYWIEFPKHLYDSGEIGNKIACRLLDEHGIKAVIVEDYKKPDDEGGTALVEAD
ncbi:MAG: hypothetical protein AAGA46_00230 [Cyanobacteria bacterium P01_F01_bin.13]